MALVGNLKTAVDGLTTRIDQVIPRLTDTVADADVQAEADRVNAQNARIDAALNPPTETGSTEG